MFTKDRQLMKDITVCLTTMFDYEKEYPFPMIKSVIYMGMGVDFGRFQILEFTLVRMGYVKADSTTLKLTDIGRVKASKLSDILNKVK